LVELVKNAYDADATKVTIQIDPYWNSGPDIRITDNGSGMTFDEVKRYWMRIATTHKQSKNFSPRYGRPRTGSKGIGRFACRRLGTNLRLITTAALNGSFEKTEVYFPWLEFTPGKEISTIDCEGDNEKLDDTLTGTTLIISDSPSDEWRKRGYDYLKRQLAVLTANRGTRRPGYEEDPGFNVRIEAPDFEEDIDNLREHLIYAGWGDINLRIDSKGKVTCKLDAMTVGRRKIVHPEYFPKLAGVSAKIGIMPIERDEIRKKDILSKASLTQIVEEWGGVFIRHKGFRVYPYGDPFNDWLRIDHDRGLRRTSLSPLLTSFSANLQGVNPKRTLLSLLSSRAYIGDVEIGEKAARYFEPKASREGFIADEGISSLAEVVRFAIDWSTIYREYARALETREEAELAREELEEKLKEEVEPREVVAVALRVLNNEVKNLANQLPTSERQQILRSFRTATEAIAKHEASNREELRHLQLVASTSTLLLIFSHEVKSLLSWFEQVRISLDTIQRKITGPAGSRLGEISNEFKETKERLLDLVSMTSLISITRRAEPARLTLLPRVDRAIRSFNLICTKYNIKIDTNEINRTLQIGPIMEAELFAVLLNVLSNAIKSVIAAGGKRKIALFAERKGQKVVLHIRDNGIGISEDFFEEVFLPFSSDPGNRIYRGLEAKMNPEDEYIVGTGSGLGLSIAREIISNRKGSIRFVRPSEGWNADIEIILP
jgi:signal transduction histidine kinase